MVDRENLPRPGPEGDPLDGGMPLDRPQAATDWGTTASEQLRSEPLAIRLRREETEDGSEDIGFDDDLAEDRQFLEPGGETGLTDDEGDMFGGSGAGLDEILSAEEAAMRVVEEPGGMNYDPDPGYIDRP